MHNKMAAVLLLLLVIVCLTLQPPCAAAPDCRYQVPSTRRDGLCETYDLSKLAALGPFSLNGSSSNLGLHGSTGEAERVVYYLSLCEDVPEDFLPKECAGVGKAPAYQYTEGKACVALGSLNDVVALPVDPMDATSGVRIVYRLNATKSSAEHPYAVLYDLHCDPTATANQPISAFEWPQNTIKVRWPSQFACSLGASSGVCPRFKYDGTWNTIRLRSRPSWFDEAKFGIFLHWGVFSVPSFADHHGAEWYWRVLHERFPDTVEFHNRVYGCSGIDPEKYPCTGPKFSYYDFPPMFRAEMFSPTHWANLFSKAGAKYVVLTSKHHEGWCNFPSSQHWNWNSADLGPYRDLVGELTNSVVKAGLVMGLYHSLREWYNPLYMKDEADNCSTTDFPDKICNPTMTDMINAYKPMVLWNDGAGDAPCQRHSEYWDAPSFRSWVYNESPVRDSIVINERCGSGCVGDYTNGPDRNTPGHLVQNKWESGFTIQTHSWGYDRRDNIDPYLSTDRLIYQLVSTVACNGNLLLNVGPTADGRIDPIFEERLLDIGAWLEVNGEAIYSSSPWRVQFDSVDKKTWFTTSKDGKSVYAITFGSVTPGGTVMLMHPLTSSYTTVSLLGHTPPLMWTPQEGSGLNIQVPLDLDRRILGDKCAWTFKLQNVM